MKMRVSIARALVTQPELLLMDEPFAALDEITRFQLNDDLLALWQALRKTVVFVTHSVFESVYLSQPHRRDDAAARAAWSPRSPSTRPIRATRPSAPRPNTRDCCRLASQALGAGHGGERGVSAPSRARARPRARRFARSASRFAVLALGVLAWDLVVRLNGIPPYVLPGPGLVAAHARRRLGRALRLAPASRWRRPSRGLLLARRRRRRPGGPVQPVAADRVLALSLTR